MKQWHDIITVYGYEIITDDTSSSFIHNRYETTLHEPFRFYSMISVVFDGFVYDQCDITPNIIIGFQVEQNYDIQNVLSLAEQLHYTIKIEQEQDIDKDFFLDSPQFHSGIEWVPT
jgi:hypothetical protein